jgi:hypothetical protein
VIWLDHVEPYIPLYHSHYPLSAPPRGDDTVHFIFVVNIRRWGWVMVYNREKTGGGVE